MPDLIARTKEARSLHRNLKAALARVMPQRVEADAQDRLAALDQDEAFRRSPRAHRAQVQADIEGELRQARTSAAGVLLYQATCLLPAVEAELSTVRASAMQPPQAIKAYLARTGGQRVNLSDQTELLIQLLDEARRARCRAELTDQPPSVVMARYGAALISSSDEADSLIRFVESTHGSGWTGALPTADAEVDCVVRLRRLIGEAQSARVPPECDEAAAAVADLAKVASRAAAWHDVRPSNPDRDTAAARAYAAEREALEAEAAEAAAAEAAGVEA